MYSPTTNVLRTNNPLEDELKESSIKQLVYKKKLYSLATSWTCKNSTCDWRWVLNKTEHKYLCHATSGALQFGSLMDIINLLAHRCFTGSGTLDSPLKAFHVLPPESARTQLILAGGSTESDIEVFTFSLKVFFREPKFCDKKQKILSTRTGVKAITDLGVNWNEAINSPSHGCPV